jgi:DNA-directed RNA polymerase subunit M/transcription elongation factor TFIIS
MRVRQVIFGIESTLINIPTGKEYGIMKCPRCGEYMTTVNQKGSYPPKRIEKCSFCGYTIPSVTSDTTTTLTTPNIQKIKPAKKRKKATRQFNINKPIALGMLTLGLAFLVLSVLYSLYIPAFVGLGLTFWGALLLYVTPTKQVKLELLNATLAPALANTEKMLANLKPGAKGIYLPPKYLTQALESSLMFIPTKEEQRLPKPEEIDAEKLRSRNPNGIFLTPQGAALSRLFEKELGTSFITIDLEHLQKKLPKLLIENLEIAENMEIKAEDNTITVEITEDVFSSIYKETEKLSKTRGTMGSILSSAIACALARATGEPIVIEKEEQSQDGKTTEIQYRLMEE